MRSQNLIAVWVVALLLGSGRAWAEGLACAVAEAGGSADVMVSGGWQPAQKGMALSGGSQLRTGRDGSITLAFSDASKVRLGPSSNFTLDDVQASHVGLTLSLGHLDAWIHKLRGRTFEAHTPTAVAAVRGTVFSFQVERDGSTDFQLFSGRLMITDPSGRTVTLNPNQALRTSTSGGATVAPKPLPAGAAAPAEPSVALPPAPNGQPSGSQTQAPPPPPPATPQQNTQAGVSGSGP